MIGGVRVNLVPYGDAFLKREARWRNSEAAFWASAGDRAIASHAQIEREQNARADSHTHHPASLWFGIQTKDGAPLGDIMLNWIQYHHRNAMIGMSINEPATWGQGYGSDALLLLVEYTFNWLDLRRVWFYTMGTNVRMQRLAEKAGFTLEATRRAVLWADGARDDRLAYGLLRDEWPGYDVLVDRLGLRS